MDKPQLAAKQTSVEQIILVELQRKIVRSLIESKHWTFDTKAVDYPKIEVNYHPEGGNHGRHHIGIFSRNTQEAAFPEHWISVSFCDEGIGVISGIHLTNISLHDPDYEQKVINDIIKRVFNWGKSYKSLTTNHWADQ